MNTTTRMCVVLMSARRLPGHSSKLSESSICPSANSPHILDEVFPNTDKSAHDKVGTEFVLDDGSISSVIDK